ncbi:MAG: GNAT family N-acetyltransferase [Actinomycetota bacterium]
MPLPPDVVIRDARPDELDAVADVIAQAYAEYGPSEDSSVETHDAFRGYRKDIVDVRGRAERGAVAIVAERGGRVIGTVTYYPPGVDKSASGWPEEIGAIRLLGVLPPERGNAIGRALTEESIRRTRDAGAPAMGLHTTSLMAQAREMYERMGFVRTPENDFRESPELLITAYRLEL